MKLLTRVFLLGLVSVFASNIALAEKKVVPEFIEGTIRVSAEEIISLLDDQPDLVILDSRKASDFKKGFIEGAISLPNTDTNPDSLAKHAAGKATPVLFYCNGIRCGRSVKAAKIALDAGYSKVYWFRGGMEEWEAKGLPVVHN